MIKPYIFTGSTQAMLARDAGTGRAAAASATPAVSSTTRPPSAASVSRPPGAMASWRTATWQAKWPLEMALGMRSGAVFGAAPGYKR